MQCALLKIEVITLGNKIVHPYKNINIYSTVNARLNLGHVHEHWCISMATSLLFRGGWYADPSANRWSRSSSGIQIAVFDSFRRMLK